MTRDSLRDLLSARARTRAELARALDALDDDRLDEFEADLVAMGVDLDDVRAEMLRAARARRVQPQTVH